MVRGNGGMGERGIGIKVIGIKKCACCDEHQVLYGTVESLYCTPETNITLCWPTGIEIKT